MVEKRLADWISRPCYSPGDAWETPGRGRKNLGRGRTFQVVKPLGETAPGMNPGELDEAIGLILKMRDRGLTIIIVKQAHLGI